MEIDLFTLVAQIINLFILLFLLRKFLYLPVLKAVAERQKTIADEISAAQEAQANAQRMVKSCEKQMQKLETQKQNILQQAHEQADRLAQELTVNAHKEYAAAQKNWQKRMENEQASFETAMQRAVAIQFNHFAQKALRQIADVDINEAAVASLIKQVKALSPEDAASYIAAFQNKKQIEIQSATALNDKIKAKLEEFLRSAWKLSPSLQFKFKINPELIGGLCLIADEQLISWNLEEYLQEFGRNLNKEATQFLNRGKYD